MSQGPVSRGPRNASFNVESGTARMTGNRKLRSGLPAEAQLLSRRRSTRAPGSVSRRELFDASFSFESSTCGDEPSWSRQNGLHAQSDLQKLERDLEMSDTRDDMRSAGITSGLLHPQPTT